MCKHGQIHIAHKFWHKVCLESVYMGCLDMHV